MIAAALALAALPAPAQERVPRVDVEAAIDRGVEHLLSRQELDGTWSYAGGGPRPGCNALIVYALLKSGVPRRHHAVQRALANLEVVPPEHTYDVACLVLALTAQDRVARREWIERLAAWLLSVQDGGFGYPSGQDLSNTQYAALALRAAALGGFEVPRRSWLDLAEVTLRHQQGDGGFSYHESGEGATTGSMTAAGVGLVATCEEMLARDGKAVPKKLAQRMAEGRERGLEWLAKRFSVERNPGSGAWLGYYLYGLERVGALAEVSELGGHDWYAEGASFLVREQSAAGGWSESLGDGLESTAFALLFLSRATAPVTGEENARRRMRLRSTDLEEAPIALTVSGDTPLAMWISGWRDEERRALEWPGEEGQGPRVEEICYYAGDRELGTIPGRPGRPVREERFALRHTFERPGTYTLRARVLARTPPRTDPGGRFWPSALRALDSAPLEVEVVEVVPESLLEAARDPARNLLDDAGVQASASSLASRHHPARDAVDGSQSTAWLAAADDEAPTLALKLSRPTRADRLLVGHARTLPLIRGRFARALKLEVVVNGEQRFTLPMHPNEERKSVLRFPRPLVVRELELRIPFRVSGRDGERICGLAEVELQL